MYNTLETLDFGEEWRLMDAARKKPATPEAWDARAKSYTRQTKGHSEYAPMFLDFAGIKPGESVFDMGCGPGTLSIPLAEMGCRVVAVDFSGQMLACLEEAAEEHRVSHLITVIQASWEDDWDALGIPVCDVALASRSIATPDMEASLEKLAGKARRRVCVTLPTRDSPRYDKVLWDAVGRSRRVMSEALYGVGILFQQGINPDMRMIVTDKNSGFPTREEACENARAALGPLTEDEEHRFEEYCKRYIVPMVDEDGQEIWLRDYECKTYWAFISWNL